MPRFNTRGQSVGGVGDGVVSISTLAGLAISRIIVGEGGCACWYDDDRIIFNGPLKGVWQLLVFDQRTPTVPPKALVAAGVNFIVGSGGQFGAVGAAGFFGSIPVGPEWRLSLADTDSRGAGDRLGTIALTHQDGLGFSLFTPKTVRRVDAAPGVAAYKLTVVSWDQAIWPSGDGYATLNLPVPQVAGRPSRACWCVVAGVPWIVTWYETIGLVAHRVDDASVGVIIGSSPTFFHYDAIEHDGTIRVTWSSSTSERPDLVNITDLDLSNLTPLARPVFKPFNHPVLIAPFKDPDGQSHAPAEIVVNQTSQSARRPYFAHRDSLGGPFVAGSSLLGIYTEDADPTSTVALADAMLTRVMICHDSVDDWTIPAGHLRPWDICAIEYYRHPLETLDKSVDRWRRQTLAMLTQWPGDCAVIPQFYCQGGAPPNEVWTVQQVVDGLRFVSDLVNLSPRIKVVAPFSFLRGNGITAHAELRAVFDQLLTMSPGLPTLLEVGDSMPVKPVITVRDYAKTLRPNTATTLVAMKIGDTDVVVRLDANSNLFVDASNAAGVEHTGRPDRHVDIGSGAVVPPPTPVPVPSPPSPAPPPSSDDRVTFKTVSGHYLFVDANARIVASQTTPSDRARFTVGQEDGGISLKASTGLFVSAENGGGGELVANRPSVGIWETFKVQPQPVGIALQVHDGRFVSPQQGGGGLVLANGPAVGAWELLKPSGPLFGGRVGRGIVRSSGRVFVDDVGPFAPFGTSLFWGLWGHEHDPGRTEQNLAKARNIGCDYTRDFGEVGGGSWSDREIRPANANYRDLLASWLDLKFGKYSLRTALTIFAGGTGVNPDLATDKIIDAVRGREQSILYFEIANEAFQNFPDRDLMRRLVRKLREAFPSMLVASSSPDLGNNPIAPGTFDLDVANLFIAHTERQDGDDSWRQVRQPVDFYDLPTVGDGNEPPGLQSSVAMLSDPLRLAMLRAVGITSGMAAFVLHTGAGVRGGGAADLATGKPYLPRKANLFEYSELDAIGRAIRNVTDLVPVESSNWRKTKGHWTDSPLTSDVVWSDNPAALDHGCVRVYGSYSDRAFVEHVIGVRRFVKIIARGDWHVRAFDALTKTLAFEADVRTGDSFILPGNPQRGPGPQDADSDTAYIVLGSR